MITQLEPGGTISILKTHGMGPNPIEKAKMRRLTWWFDNRIMMMIGDKKLRFMRP